MILQVRDGTGKMRDIWWNGRSSNTLGPFVNHACDHESNIDIVCDSSRKFMPILVAKKFIKKGQELLMDYGYDYTVEDEGDSSMDWLRDYECRFCKRRTCIVDAN
jgi:SET domain-containing protein